MIINLDGTATEVMISDDREPSPQHSDRSSYHPSGQKDDSDSLRVSTDSGMRLRKRTLKLASKLQERFRKENQQGPEKILFSRQSWEENAELAKIV